MIDNEMLVRLMDKIDTTGECWEWRAGTRKGYGAFWIGGTIICDAHVVMWAFTNGRWPAEGMVIRHLCNNKVCVNPMHLIEGTKSENAMDSVRVGTHAYANKTHCPRGHEYNAINTYVNPAGRRICRMCNKLFGNRRRK